MAIELSDPLIRDVLVGIVGNGLWSLAAQSGIRAIKGVKACVSPPGPAVLTTIRTALDQLQKSTESESGSKHSRLISYLKSPEVESIVRQLFATSLIAPAKSATLDEIRSEFLLSMSSYLDIDELRLKDFANSIFDGLVESAGNALRAMVEKGSLPAHEAMDAARHQMLLDEVSNLRRNVGLLTSRPVLDARAILEFEGKYREQVASVYGFIKPPHLESGRRVPIDEIFVAPGISRVGDQKTHEPDNLELPSFLFGLYRAVLLGNPGGGKSTVSAKICHDLATRYADRLFAGREVTPVLVVLREFGSQKKSTGCSIAQFIAKQATSRYQLDPPERAFEYLLLNGRLLVIFDGLDELLDTSYRQEVTSNVESFCKLYPSVPILVTSREVGYEQAPLNEKLFRLFRLAPFTEGQVREYADKWFARDEDFTPEQRAQKSRAFYSDSSLVPDLRSNPLMLGLMCNLYRTEGYIPRNRPEVYSKCSMMLFEKWDKGRDILVPLPFEEHLRPAMEDLAYWIYSSDDLQGGVAETDLVEKSTEYLNTWVFDDIYKARGAACEFIQFCTGRAWVFTDTGTAASGERLFQFTHRTFLEYFTACHLVSIHPTPDPLANFLKDRISRREWDVVAQLAFQIQSKRVQGAADRLLGLLLRQPSPDTSSRWNSLSFAERSLEFLVPSPKVRREIAQAGLAFWLQLAIPQRRQSPDRPPEFRSDAAEHIYNLLVVASENRGTIAEEIESFLNRSIASTDIREASLCAELILILIHPSHLRPVLRVSEEESVFWSDFAQRFTGANSCRILSLGEVDSTVALKCCWEKLMNLSDAIRLFGIPFLVISIRSAVMNSWYFPTGYALAGSVLGFPWANAESDSTRAEGALQLESIAEIFLVTPVPWVVLEQANSHPFGNWLLSYSPSGSERGIKPIGRSPAADFAIICLLAVEVESRINMGEPLKGHRLDQAWMVPDDLKRVLIGRIDSSLVPTSIAALDDFSFDEARKTFLARWVRRQIDFVRPSPKDEVLRD